MGLRRGQRYIHFTDEQVSEMKRRYASGVSGYRLGQMYDVCTETALKIVHDEWTPRSVKLPTSNEVLYMDYLLLGSFGAVARKYDVTDKAVKKRLKPYMESIGAEPEYVPVPRKLPESDRQVYLDYLELVTYVALARKYDVAPRTARVRILKIIESGKVDEYRAAWRERTWT